MNLKLQYFDRNYYAAVICITEGYSVSKSLKEMDIWPRNDEEEKIAENSKYIKTTSSKRHGNEKRPEVSVLEDMVYNQELKVKEIAAKLGVHEMTVRNWLSDLGILARSGNRYKVREHQLKELLIEKQMSISEISKQLNVCEATVYGAIKRFKIKG